MDTEETMRGAINRATRALGEVGDADVGMGVEVGYHPNSRGDFEMFCWASLVNREGVEVICRSEPLLLPDFHQKVLKENKYLGDFVRIFLAENPDRKSQEIGIIIRDRKPFIEASVESAVLEYLKCMLKP